MQCQGSGTSNGSGLVGGTARAGEIGSQEDPCLGGLGADECGQWQETGISEDEGWTDRSAQCAIHVDLGGDEIQPVDQGTVSRIVEAGEGEEGGVDCLYAKVPDHLECDDARQSPFQADGACLKRTGFPFKGGFCS